MIDVAIEIIRNIFGGTDFLVPIVIVLGILVATGITWKHLKHPKYLAPLWIKVAITGGIFAFLPLVSAKMFYAVDEKNIRHIILLTIYYAAVVTSVAFMLQQIVKSVRTYRYLQKELNQVMYLTKQDSLGNDPVIAWNHLADLKPSLMMPKQEEQYRKHRILLQMQMGYFSGAEKEIEKWKNRDCAYYQFLCFYRAYMTGKIQEAAECIKNADSSINADTDSFIRLQILINHGVSYVVQKKYQMADDCFERAIHYANENNIQDKGLWLNVYYNYAFNLTRLSSSEEGWKDALATLKEHLNMNDVVDYVSFSNMELELLLQTHADPQAIQKNLDDCLKHIQGSGLQDNQRCMLETGIARTVWGTQANPEQVLFVLEKDREQLLRLPMPQRYECMNRIDQVFLHLYGPITKTYSELKEVVHRYIEKQAFSDLEQYQKQLPMEAVYGRAYCFCEMARLQRVKEGVYRWETALEYYASAIALFEEQGNDLEANKYRLEVADEGLLPLNLDSQYRSRYEAYIREALSKIEGFVPFLEQDPIVFEFFVRLSFYYYRLQDYVKCKQYYDASCKIKEAVPLDSYAPWLRKQYFQICIVTRVFYFQEAILKIEKSKGFHDYRESVRECLHQLTLHSSLATTIILACFIGCPFMVKTCALGQDANETRHMWLCLESSVFSDEIDLTYSSHVTNEDAQTIFFPPGGHPLESDKVQKGFPAKFLETMQDDICDVLSVIEELVPDTCPTQQDIMQIMPDNGDPIAIRGYSEPADSGHLNRAYSLQLKNYLDMLPESMRKHVSHISQSKKDFYGLIRKDLETIYGYPIDWQKTVEGYYKDAEGCRHIHNYEEIPELSLTELEEMLKEEQRDINRLQKAREYIEILNTKDNHLSGLELSKLVDTCAKFFGIYPILTKDSYFRYLLPRGNVSDEERFQKYYANGNVTSIILNLMKHLTEPGFVVEYEEVGAVVTQQRRKYYYRGENAIYASSKPSIHRGVKGQKEPFIRMLRILECWNFLDQFDAVKHWGVSAVNYMALAQHYGLRTSMLDITSDLRTALFFMCCKYQDGKWHPLGKAETLKKNSRKEIPDDGDSRYGILYRGLSEIIDLEENSSFIPIGCQPFMRCSEQYGYMLLENGKEIDLYQDRRFEKFKVRLTEDLCDWIYEEMDQGKKVYPQKDVPDIEEYIAKINETMVFTESVVKNLTDSLGIDYKFLQMELLKQGILIQENIDWISPEELKRINESYGIDVATANMSESPKMAPLIVI